MTQPSISAESALWSLALIVVGALAAWSLQAATRTGVALQDLRDLAARNAQNITRIETELEGHTATWLAWREGYTKRADDRHTQHERDAHRLEREVAELRALWQRRLHEPIRMGPPPGGEDET